MSDHVNFSARFFLVFHFFCSNFQQSFMISSFSSVFEPIINSEIFEIFHQFIEFYFFNFFKKKQKLYNKNEFVQ